MDSGTDEATAWLADQLTCGTVREVEIGALTLDFTVRETPVDTGHVGVLAELGANVPPIVVHEPSGRVIDGVHRVRACLAGGREHIPAIMYRGSGADAFVVAVRLNTTHGLPLSRAERSAAAERILCTHPQWSNRMIAGITGLSEATVRTRRHGVAASGPQPRARVGQDGRVRPVDSGEGRERVGRLLAEKPAASARAIAREAGVSPNTVLDVQRRLARGQDAAPTRDGEGGAPGAPAAGETGGLTDITQGVLVDLMSDPSLRLTDRGRHLIRWMQANREALGSTGDVVDAIPDRWSLPVARVARAYALFWQELAHTLELRPDEEPMPSLARLPARDGANAGTLRAPSAAGR